MNPQFLSKINNNKQTNDQCKCEHITESNLLESFITSEEILISSTDDDDGDGNDDVDDDYDECTSLKLNKALLKKSNSIRNTTNNNKNFYSLTNKGSTLTINKDKLVMYIKRSFKHTK